MKGSNSKKNRVIPRCIITAFITQFVLSVNAQNDSTRWQNVKDQLRFIHKENESQNWRFPQSLNINHFRQFQPKVDSTDAACNFILYRCNYRNQLKNELAELENLEAEKFSLLSKYGHLISIEKHRKKIDELLRSSLDILKPTDSARSIRNAKFLKEFYSQSLKVTASVLLNHVLKEIEELDALKASNITEIECLQHHKVNLCEKELSRWAVYNNKRVYLPSSKTYSSVSSLDFLGGLPPHRDLFDMEDFRYHVDEDSPVYQMCTKKLKDGSFELALREIYSEGYVTHDCFRVSPSRLLIVGSFLDKSSYKHHREGFVAIVDLLEKDLFKRVKKFKLITSTNEGRSLDNMVFDVVIDKNQNIYLSHYSVGVNYKYRWEVIKLNRNFEMVWRCETLRNTCIEGLTITNQGDVVIVEGMGILLSNGKRFNLLKIDGVNGEVIWRNNLIGDGLLGEFKDLKVHDNIVFLLFNFSYIGTKSQWSVLPNGRPGRNMAIYKNRVSGERFPIIPFFSETPTFTESLMLRENQIFISSSKHIDSRFVKMLNDFQDETSFDCQTKTFQSIKKTRFNFILEVDDL